MRLHRSAFIAPLGFCLACPFVVLATSGTPTWSLSLVSTVDPNSYASAPDLAFDHYGTPSISWSAASNIGGPNSVRHSQLLGLGIWSNREMFSASGAGVRTAISFDRSERPAVAWINDNGAVQGQFNYGSNQSVSPAGAMTLPPVLSMYYDLTGTLRGMYSTSTAGVFSSIGFSGSSFTSGALTTISGVSNVYDAKMAVDGRGLRQLAARTALSAGGQALSLASEPPSGGSAWPSSNFVVADAVDGVDVELDPADGRLAIAYTTYTAGTNTSRLFYSKFNGGSVATTPVLSSTSERYQDVSLAFDRADGRPAIAYERKVTATSAQELWYAFLNASSAWQTSLVDATISVDLANAMPRGPSLAFDDYGTSWPAIAYVDANGSLNVAFDPPAPEPGTVVLVSVFLIFGWRRHGARSASLV